MPSGGIVGMPIHIYCSGIDENTPELICTIDDFTLGVDSVNTGIIYTTIPDIDPGNYQLICAVGSNMQDSIFALTVVPNSIGQTEFGLPQVISTSVDATRSLFISDINNDQRLDIILGASDLSRPLGWFQKHPNEASFYSHSNITPTYNGSGYGVSADLDNDGYMDVVGSFSHGYLSDGAMVYLNTAGNGYSWTNYSLSYNSPYVHMSCEDIDNDGDIDILTAGGLTDVKLFRNNGSGYSEVDPKNWTVA